MTAPTTPMPALFLGHGSPMNTLERNRYTDAWRRLGAQLPRPKAILAISAHWYTRGAAVTATAAPRTIHDFGNRIEPRAAVQGCTDCGFGGFPRELFEVQYPAPGDPALAEHVRDLLAPLPVALDHDWGLDHGTWSVLAHVFPAADLPVVQLSIDRDRAPRWHYELGARLAPLRAEGVLILGSGNVVHNLGRMQWDEGARPYDWAQRFNDRVRDALAAGTHETLIDYTALDAETARLSVPTPEH